MPPKSPPPSDQPQVYQLKITLDDSKPPIWRRIQVEGDEMLDVLHVIIQLAMGWENSHLHMFKVGKQTYAPPDPDAYMELSDLDESEYMLSEIAPAEKAKFSYQYDFGDSWDHTILVEKILPPDPKTEYPICLDGARACPLEDSGGIYGYEEKLKILKDPKHEDYEDVADWMGEDYDPEEFSVEETNEALSDLDDYIDELDAISMMDPAEILGMLLEGMQVLKESIQQVRRLSTGVVLDLPYDPEVMSAAFQFSLFHHPSTMEVKFSLEIGPKEAVRLQITGPKEDLAQIQQMLGIEPM